MWPRLHLNTCSVHGTDVPGVELLGRKVLRAIKDGHLYGLEIMDATDLPDGTVYKTLHRMERRGLVRARWEEANLAEGERRPRRRYYEVTTDGVEELIAVARRFEALARGLDTPAVGEAPK